MIEIVGKFGFILLFSYKRLLSMDMMNMNSEDRSYMINSYLDTIMTSYKRLYMIVTVSTRYNDYLFKIMITALTSMRPSDPAGRKRLLTIITLSGTNWL